MGQLEDLQRNRLARMQHIQKGFCGDDNQDDIVKAHNVGDVHPNHPDWVWTQLPNGKYDWRVRKGQAKPAPTPVPKPSGEPDFTPKYPAAIQGLTNRSGFDAFRAAYDSLGADLFAEKFPTEADWKKNSRYGMYSKEQMMRLLARDYTGDNSGASKTAQIAKMKGYYEDKAKAAKDAHQKKKNEAYWASAEGSKRKADIEKERNAIVAERQKLKDDATKDIRGIMGVNGQYEMKVNLDGWNNSVQIDIGKHWDCVSFYVSKDWFNRSDDYKTELSYASSRFNCDDAQAKQEATTLLQCAASIAANADKIKKTIIPYGEKWEETSKKLRELNKELEANH